MIIYFFFLMFFFLIYIYIFFFTMLCCVFQYCLFFPRFGSSFMAVLLILLFYDVVCTVFALKNLGSGSLAESKLGLSQRQGHVDGLDVLIAFT